MMDQPQLRTTLLSHPSNTNACVIIVRSCFLFLFLFHFFMLHWLMVKSGILNLKIQGSIIEHVCDTKVGQYECVIIYKNKIALSQVTQVLFCSLSLSLLPQSNVGSSIVGVNYNQLLVQGLIIIMTNFGLDDMGPISTKMNLYMAQSCFVKNQKVIKLLSITVKFLSIYLYFYQNAIFMHKVDLNIGLTSFCIQLTFTMLMERDIQIKDHGVSLFLRQTYK